MISNPRTTEMMMDGKHLPTTKNHVSLPIVKGSYKYFPDLSKDNLRQGVGPSTVLYCLTQDVVHEDGGQAPLSPRRMVKNMKNAFQRLLKW